MSLSEDQKFECKQAFNFYGNGTSLNNEEFFAAMKSLGILFSALDKRKMETENTKGYTLEDVEKYYLDRVVLSNTEDDFMETFKILDSSGSGKVNFEELEHILTHLGERMSKDEISDCFANLNKDGEVDLHDLAVFLAQ